MESNRTKNKEKKKIVIDPTERKKISVTQDVNELEFIVDSESGNNDDADDGTNDADDEQEENKEISNMTSDFIRILDLFHEPDEEINNEAEEITLTGMSNEVVVVTLKCNDGEEYRTQNPYPEHNNGVFRQEKLNGTRAIKIDLITLYPNDVKLPSLDEL